MRFGKLLVKVLTVVFLFAFLSTIIWCPWLCAGYVHRYSPFWQIPPCQFGYTNGIFWSQLIVEWVGLAAIYAGLRSLLK
jgi:hypothetical protein